MSRRVHMCVNTPFLSTKTAFKESSTIPFLNHGKYPFYNLLSFFKKKSSALIYSAYKLSANNWNKLLEGKNTNWRWYFYAIIFPCVIVSTFIATDITIFCQNTLFFTQQTSPVLTLLVKNGDKEAKTWTRGADETKPNHNVQYCLCNLSTSIIQLNESVQNGVILWPTVQEL